MSHSSSELKFPSDLIWLAFSVIAGLALWTIIVLITAPSNVGSIVELVLSLFCATGWSKFFSLRKRIEKSCVRLRAALPPSQELERKSKTSSWPEPERTVESVVVGIGDILTERRLLLEKTEDVICSLDENGVFVHVSPGSFGAWGYKPDELIGKPVGFILPHNDESSKEPDVISSTSAAFLALLTEYSASGRFETAIKRKSGSLGTLSWSIHWSQSEKCFSCIAHDISVRKELETRVAESEGRLRMILDTLPVGIFLIDSRSVIGFANLFASKMFEWPKADLLQLDIRKLFGNAHDLSYESLSAQRGNLRHCNAIRKNGSIFPCEVLASAWDSEQSPAIIVAVLDTSEAEKLKQLRQEFVASVTHDLRTPLTATDGFLQGLSSGIYGEVSGDIERKALAASKNIKHLIFLANNLLDIEKAESGNLILNKCDTNLEELISSAIEGVQEIAQTSKVAIEKHCEPDLVTEIDPDKFLQVLNNLLSNAAKFSPEGSTITVGSYRGASNTILFVEDEGCGIPSSERERIFDRFYQIPDKSRIQQGYGLGLAICRTIVEQHGGNICAENRHKGCRFEITLPSAED